MKIIIKKPEEIKLMRESGRILATIFQELTNFVKPGMSTKDVDKYAETLTRKFNVKPAFKGYQGFPGVICASVNENVVHSIPTKDRILKDGDIFTIDCGVIYKGWYSDSAITLLIGDVDPKVKEFVSVVKKALYMAIEKVKPGLPINIIGETIQKYVEGKHGYSIVKELTGHGIGRQLHEDPFVFNFADKGNSPIMKEGMTIAIEPIANMGSGKIKTLRDKWTVISADKSMSCQWEHTIAITKNGAEILTQL
ncbi:type I methionyl aminopeptidase [Patescibacteria group bacterium]|nr:type I methionyl aminopeptidase [Patescibacteria group bacterium]